VGICLNHTACVILAKCLTTSFHRILSKTLTGNLRVAHFIYEDND
jgi:hypothetical protein